MNRASVVTMALSVLALLSATAAAQERQRPAQGMPGEAKESRDARMKWWREARFGMFIHWGIYSVPAGTYKGEQIPGIGEWIQQRAKIPVAEYAGYAKQFNPTKYDPDAWVRLAKDAGMKYIVITSKHHDGFALFDSKATDFDVVDATPYKQDLLKPLAEACRKHGLKLGFYYSQAQDWHHKGGSAIGGHWDPAAQDGSMDEYIRNIAVPQVKEILGNYGDIAALWWDTPHEMNKERADLLLPLVKLQPHIITNNRLGAGYPGDTETPEQYIPATGYPGRDWETCMTMNDTWGFKSYDQNWKPTEKLVRQLVEAASKGGNYLLNVGPTSEGEIPQPSIERLRAVGEWVKVYGDAVYGTSASPFKKYSFDGRATVRGNQLFLHVFNWPEDGIKVSGLTTKVEKVHLLRGGATAEWASENDERGVNVLKIAKPASPDPIATVVVVECAGPPEVDPRSFATSPGADGTLHLRAGEAQINGRGARLESAVGGENIGRWTDARAFLTWDILLPAASQYEVELDYSCQDARAGAEVEMSIGDQSSAKLTGTISGTGGWGDYKTMSLGTIDLPKGTHSLRLRPTTMPSGGVMNLREARLTPKK